MYITASLMGGLGNQLFQIFATIAHAIQTKNNYIFIYSELLTVGKTRNTYWKTLLDKLLMYTTINLEFELTNKDVDEFPIHRENGFKYTPLPIFENRNTKLFGYFQSYKYFKDQFEHICDMIDLRKKQEEIKREYSMFVGSSTEKHVISMHFRVGDYKYIQGYHPIMPYEYYCNALSHILISHKENDKPLEYQVNYFCQKEDNQYVLDIVTKMRIKYPAIEFLKVDDTIDDWKQMLIMSCSHDNIIANSSFSWWAAYFNETSNKVVCYPNIWFGPDATDHNVGDLFPPSWQKITTHF